jgi:phospholipid transport system substrate-binding protein
MRLKPKSAIKGEQARRLKRMDALFRLLKGFFMKMHKRFCLFFSLLILLLSGHATHGLAAPAADGQPETSPSARAVISRLDDTLLTCMKQGEKLGFQGRYNLLLPVMKEAFWYSLMVRKTTGSYWRKMTPREQNILLEKYITWSVSSYAERFTSYNGQRFVISLSKPFRVKYWRVVVDIFKQDKKKRSLEYLLAFDSEKQNWRIVDIRVKGVSQLSLTRAQFKAVLKLSGVDGLLTLLDEKIASLRPEAGVD